MAHPGARPQYEDPATIDLLKQLEVAPDSEQERGGEGPQSAAEDVLHQSGRRWQMTQTVLPQLGIPREDRAGWDEDPEMSDFLRRQVGGEHAAALLMGNGVHDVKLATCNQPDLLR
jgi:hypothetical protein